MADIVFKVFFGDKAATRDQLDRLEDITVEQEQDVAWGASVKIPICTDEKGNWADADEKFFASFSRVRVEIKVGDGPFTPLIDGPIVGADHTLSTHWARRMAIGLIGDFLRQRWGLHMEAATPEVSADAA